MPTNPNMVAIQTVTVGAGGASSIEFASIPQTYTDLVLHFSGRGTQTAGVVADIDLQFNSSTANFSRRTLRGSGSAASSTSASDNYGAAVTGNSATASTFGSWQIYIPNYTSSNNKSFSIDTVTENNATEAWQYMLAGLWSNSAAISNIKVVPQTGTWMQYSTATLYGVTSAGYGAKATGGIITSDANYYYHTFLASGTFTPTQSLSCDVLVIAGGGSGGQVYSGGGGAGGLAQQTGRSVTATGYTVTIGAGGAGVAAGTTANGNNGSNSVFDTITANGGGGGAGWVSNTGTNGLSGGSGGGGSMGTTANTTTTGGTATQGNSGGATGYGNNGGAGARGTGSAYFGGGGGGAGAVGQAATFTAPGNGGNGLNTWSSWATTTGTGVNGYYAGGGGGAAEGGAQSSGGAGGGGAGNVYPSPLTTNNATANTGSGGGGSVNTVTSGAGGSGIVIVRYAK